MTECRICLKLSISFLSALVVFKKLVYIFGEFRKIKVFLSIPLSCFIYLLVHSLYPPFHHDIDFFLSLPLSLISLPGG